MPCVSLKNLSFLLFCDLRFYSGLNCFDFWLSVSWKEALFLTLKFLNSKRISFLAGSFLDLETVWSLKSFFSNLGFFSNSSTLVDHCEGVYSTIRLRDIEKYSTFVSVANNLRLETPLINTRVRKSYNFFMSDFSFFSFGSATSYFTYSVKSISNNKFKFLSLILGKLSLSKFITGRKGNLVIFHSDVEFSIFTGLFELFIKPSFVKISRSVSILAARVFGLDFSTKGLFNYSVGCESIPSLIYQGHHGGSISYFSSLILPSSLYAEKTSSYVNFEGVIQLAHAAITPSKFVRKDWEIFAAIFELYKSVTDLYNSKIAANKLNNLLPSWNSITKHNLVISRESLMNNIFRNSLFKASILNYY
ncbi:MAG: molybdopterin-dependent oxidoreductase [Burkholderiaceae bacterium]|nr:molybdopterin-dependent oxidoreductase [Burkholderiaceae bacterium]